MMTAKMIEALEAKGMKRWTNYGKDRLYIDPEVIGLEISYLRSGYVASAYLDGEKISNSQALKMMPRGEKMYIDIQTGEIVAPSWAVERIEAMIAAVEEEETEEIIEEEGDDTTMKEKIDEILYEITGEAIDVNIAAAKKVAEKLQKVSLREGEVLTNRDKMIIEEGVHIAKDLERLLEEINKISERR